MLGGASFSPGGIGAHRARSSARLVRVPETVCPRPLTVDGSRGVAKGARSMDATPVLEDSMFMIRSIRSLTIALSLTITVPLVTSCASAAATKASTKTTKSTKPRKAAKKPVKRPVVTTIKPALTTRPVTTVKPVVTANEKVLAGYESYLTAFVAGHVNRVGRRNFFPQG